MGLHIKIKKPNFKKAFGKVANVGKGIGKGIAGSAKAIGSSAKALGKCKPGDAKCIAKGIGKISKNIALTAIKASPAGLGTAAVGGGNFNKGLTSIEKNLYKFSGIQDCVKAGEAIKKCGGNAECIAKATAMLLVAVGSVAMNFVPGAGEAAAAERTAMIAAKAVKAAEEAVKMAKTAKQIAAAEKAVAKLKTIEKSTKDLAAAKKAEEAAKTQQRLLKERLEAKAKADAKKVATKEITAVVKDERDKENLKQHNIELAKIQAKQVAAIAAAADSQAALIAAPPPGELHAYNVDKAQKQQNDISSQTPQQDAIQSAINGAASAPPTFLSKIKNMIPTKMNMFFAILLFFLALLTIYYTFYS